LTLASRPAAFLDRDGTLLDELGYLGDPDGVRLLPGVAAALVRLRRAGVATVVVTNQSGIARGYFDERAYARVQARVDSLLAAGGALLDGSYHCPHHPELGEPPWRRQCECRKPAPGMILQAARELGLDLERSFVVGDALRDLEAGRRAGVPHLYLVATGKGSATWDALDDERRRGLVHVPDLGAAVEDFLARSPV